MLYEHRDNSNDVIDIRKNNLKLTFIPSTMPIVFTYCKHLELPFSIKIFVTINMHDSYISKFEFVNYFFANLVVVWL